MGIKLRLAVALVLVASLFTATIGASAQDVEYQAFATPEFQQVWERTDYPVLHGHAVRTWIWGPGAITGLLEEPYVEGIGGIRHVQYSDKSRMEMPWNGVDPDSPWAISQGLLALEMMTGNVQLGDDTFEAHAPANIPVAGDPDDPLGPTYAVMGTLMDNEPRGQGNVITEVVTVDGHIFDNPALEVYGVTDEYFVPETGHYVASPFWEVMTSTGTVLVDGQLVEGPVFEDPFYAMGLPVTPAYWAWVKVDGVQQNVLNQCFERRCGTFTPNNPPGWMVETGNVGLHYHTWRYHMIEPVAPGVDIALSPQQAENDLYIFDLELLEIDPEEPIDVAFGAILGIDLGDDPIVLTGEQTARLMTLFAIFFGEIEMLDLEELTEEHLAILAAFEAETGLDLLTMDLGEFEEERPAAVTLLIQLETEGAIALEDLSPEGEELMVLVMEWILGIDLTVVDLATLNLHTVVATVTELGVAVAGAEVDFVVTDGGGNVVAQGSEVTGSDGTASFTYLATDAGDETITATVAGTDIQATAAKSWVLIPAPGFPVLELADPALTLEPGEPEPNVVGTEHTVTATLTDEGVPVEGAFVAFVVDGVHEMFELGTTDAQGQASFTYTGEVAGPDVIMAFVDYEDPDGEFQELMAMAQKMWVEAE